jgi:RND family efflux transporter MFP subunit
MRRVLTLAPALVLALGCGQKKPAEADKAQAKPASVEEVVVSAAKVERRDLEVAIPLTGTIRAKTEVDVASKIPGRVAAIKAEVGDEVKAGQVLVVLDRDEASLQVKQAEAQLASAKAGKEQSDLDAARAEKLSAAGASTDAELAAMKTKKTVSESSLEAARATLALSKEILSNATLTAPNAGVITRRSVNAGQMISPGVALYTVHDTSAMNLEAGIAERDLGRIKVGQEVVMGVEAYPGEAFRGRIKIIGRALDPATRKAPLTIEFPNEDGRLLSQMYARARILVEIRPGALLLPEGTLVEAKAAAAGEAPASGPAGLSRDVWVVEGGVAKRRPVTVGAIVGGKAEILSGLKEGDAVVTSGQNLLKEGVKVRVVE